MPHWFVVLGQLQPVWDVTTGSGVFALLTLHAHQIWQTRTLKKYVDDRIAGGPKK